MNAKYGVIGSGTTSEKLILWGEGFPVIELSLAGERTPTRITILGEAAPIEQTIEEAERMPAWEPAQKYEEPLREAHGWKVGVATGDGCGLYIIDPAARYHFELIGTHTELRCYVRDSSEDSDQKALTFPRDFLNEVRAWPAIPVATEAGTQSASA